MIRNEVDPESLIGRLGVAKQKMSEMAENLEAMKKKLNSAPVSCNADVLEFLDVQKRAGLWMQAESLRAQVKTRQEEYDTLIDDMAEQESLLQEYQRWKK